MQVKKEELRQQIVQAAHDEFLSKGYEESSLRMIAKKANTTLGNIYHYFPSKEALLHELCDPAVELLHKMTADHLEQEAEVHSLAELEEAFENLNQIWDSSEFQYLTDTRLLILFDLKTTSLLVEKERFLKKFKQHLSWHLNLKEDDSHYVTLITNMFIDCLRHVLLEHQDPMQAKEEFFKIFRMLCTGIIVTDSTK